MATINGTIGNDSLVGTSAADLIAGLEGDDTIAWSTGLDTIQGGAGRDRLVVGAANVTATLNDDLTVTLNGTFLSVPGPVTPGTTFTNILSGVEEIGLQSFSRDTGFQDYTLALVTAPMAMMSFWRGRA